MTSPREVGERVARQTLAVLLVAVAGVSGGAQQPTFRADIERVRLDVLVTDGGRTVQGLGPQDFDVVDSGVLQRVADVSLERLPLRLTLALDMSSSVTGERLQHLRTATDALLAGLQPMDDAQLITFSHRVVRRHPFTGNMTLLRRALDAAEPSGQTALFDAAFAAVAASESSDGRNLLLLFSDGVDTASWLSAEDVVAAARRGNVVVYGVGLRGGASVTFLRDLGRSTGGEVVEAASTRDLRARFEAVLAEFRERYLVSYAPSGVERRGWHDVVVRVKGRRLTVRARPGYQVD